MSNMFNMSNVFSDENEVMPIPNGWDIDMCFNIVDFVPGSAIEVRKSYGYSIERGVVLSTDERTMHIKYRNSAGNVYSVNINSVTFLSDPIKGWLTK